MPNEDNEILTIGHSSHSWESFIKLLRGAKVTAIADVRSFPYSRQFPQFNQEDLRQELRSDGITYVFLGNELGGRPKGREYYCEGVADYERMAQGSDFDKGLDRLMEGAKKYRIALMCSERDPLDCHRCLLVGRVLAGRGKFVRHILSDGGLVDQKQIEDQLLKLSGRQDADMFSPLSERLAAAYRDRARKIAFAEPQQVSLVR